MIETYLHFVKNYPLLSSAVQIGILGTVGELLAVRIRMGKWYFFGPGPTRLLLKMIVWAFLGITFKYAFTGFFAYIDAIIAKEWWFQLEKGSFFYALSVSFFANIIYGPVFVTFHRFTDNKIEGKEMDWKSLQKAWWSCRNASRHHTETLWRSCRCHTAHIDGHRHPDHATLF